MLILLIFTVFCLLLLKSPSCDPGRKYGIQDPNNRNNFTCNFCGKVYKGGVFRLKCHFVGGFQAVVDCKLCPEHVKEETRAYMLKKENAKLENRMNSRVLDYDDYASRIMPRLPAP